MLLKAQKEIGNKTHQTDTSLLAPAWLEQDILKDAECSKKGRFTAAEPGWWQNS